MSTELTIALVSAGAALIGSVIGGVISFVTTRDATARQWRHSLVLRELDRKESLYSEFIGECAKLLLSSIDKKESSGIAFANLYTLLGKIRMMSSTEVRSAAETLAKRCTDAHWDEGNKTGNNADSRVFEARNRFTESARAELDAIRKAVS
jgi:hypothetical protein